MSGVRVGSRVEQLRELEQRVQLELAMARRAEVDRIASGHAVPVTVQAGPVAPPTQDRPGSRLVRVPLSMVDGRALRDWARSRGYEPRRTGPLDSGVLAAFVEAHP